MVKKPDGTFMLVSDAELAQLKKENKIGVEVPKTMAGKFTDLTQKPIIILKE
jgi:CRISPR/Cas system CMR-associated protein Cmr3 (group 5 of RAMP superfamily)